MQRVPEPELMLDPRQARAYAEADFEAPHSHCVELLLERLGAALPERGVAVDLGCGPADLSLRLARALPSWRFVGVDGSTAMLELGRAAVHAAGLAERVELHELRLPAAELPGAPYDLVFSNSLLHHLPDPAVLWSTLCASGRAGAAVFVMDLVRPESPAQLRALVERYASDEPELLRRDFEASLYAAYSESELRDQLAAAGLGGLAIELVSDRHWIAWGRLAAP